MSESIVIREQLCDTDIACEAVGSACDAQRGVCHCNYSIWVYPNEDGTACLWSELTALGAILYIVMVLLQAYICIFKVRVRVRSGSGKSMTKKFLSFLILAIDFGMLLYLGSMVSYWVSLVTREDYNYGEKSELENASRMVAVFSFQLISVFICLFLVTCFIMTSSLLLRIVELHRPQEKFHVFRYRKLLTAMALAYLAVNFYPSWFTLISWAKFMWIGNGIIFPFLLLYLSMEFSRWVRSQEDSPVARRLGKISRRFHLFLADIASVLMATSFALSLMACISFWHPFFSFSALPVTCIVFANVVVSTICFYLFFDLDAAQYVSYRVVDILGWYMSAVTVCCYPFWLVFYNINNEMEPHVGIYYLPCRSKGLNKPSQTDAVDSGNAEYCACSRSDYEYTGRPYGVSGSIHIATGVDESSDAAGDRARNNCFQIDTVRRLMSAPTSAPISQRRDSIQTHFENSRLSYFEVSTGIHIMDFKGISNEDLPIEVEMPPTDFEGGALDTVRELNI